MAALQARFPEYDSGQLDLVRQVLLGVAPSAMTISSWIEFGTESQERLADLVKRRLAFAEDGRYRAVVQHLTRLHRLLNEVIEAMKGGFLKKSPTRVWSDAKPELSDLEMLLTHSDLSSVLINMDRLKSETKACADSLLAQALAAAFLAENESEKVGQLLTPRAISLTSSEALALEQLHALDLEKSRVRELLSLVQDGVLVQLTAVYSQMALLSARPSDTQRFLAQEKLVELTTFIQRKI